MENYIISCCSTADLTAEHFAQRDIHVIYFHFMLNNKQYTDDLGKSISFKNFYQALRDGADARTSQVNADEFETYFEGFLKEGKDILHVCLSSGLSGVYNSANAAKETLQKKYPERKIFVVDSLGASSGYGMPLDTLYTWVNGHRLDLHHWFFSTDLSFYVKGGRISKTSGRVGTLLGICPLLNMDYLGRLIPRFKIRTKKRVMEEIVKKMEENAQGGLAYNGKCYISQSDCYEDAAAVAKMVEERFPNLNGKVEINYVGTTIGSHTGPGTVALFFWGNTRND